MDLDTEEKQKMLAMFLLTGCAFVWIREQTLDPEPFERNWRET